MIAKARELDPAGDYRLIRDGDFGGIAPGRADIVLSAFTFDNIAAAEKDRLFRGLSSLLCPEGVLVSIVSSPEIYLHEWASFSTKEFPENRFASSGDLVKIITTDHADARAVEDILCTDDAYRDLFAGRRSEVCRRAGAARHRQ